MKKTLAKTTRYTTITTLTGVPKAAFCIGESFVKVGGDQIKNLDGYVQMSSGMHVSCSTGTFAGKCVVLSTTWKGCAYGTRIPYDDTISERKIVAAAKVFADRVQVEATQ